MTRDATATFTPADPDERIARVFAWYVTRLISKRFCALRLATESMPTFEALDAEPRPLIVVMNHQSWWDPLFGLVLARRWCPARIGRAPIDDEMLSRFKILRKVGMFGIDPDDAASLRRMGSYIGDFFASEERPTLWLTPQGEFADVRTPIRIRPGAAAIAARTHERSGVAVASIAVELPFWLDSRPEALMRMTWVDPPDDPDSTTGWHRAITATMTENQKRLAEFAIARDPTPFSVLLSKGTSGPNPVYAWWLRLTGRQADLESARTTRAKVTP